MPTLTLEGEMKNPHLKEERGIVQGVLGLGTKFAACSTEDCAPHDDGMCNSALSNTGCNTWEQTAECKKDGPIESDRDRSCSASFGPFQSGRCQCGTRAVGFDCASVDVFVLGRPTPRDRPHYTCDQVCSAGEGIFSCGRIHVSISRCHEPLDGEKISYSISTSSPQEGYQCEHVLGQRTSISIDVPENMAVYIIACITRPNMTSLVQTRKIYRRCMEAIEPLQTALISYGFRDSLAYRDDIFSGANQATHFFLHHMPYDIPVRVDSCYGGMTFYDLQTKATISGASWRDCWYKAHEDNDCEHISFHRCLRERLGWRIMMNPRLTARYLDRRD